MIWEACRGRFMVFVLLLLLACSAGCKGLFGTQGPPDDPLFLNKKPVEAKAHSSRPVAPSYSEPTPPTNPYASASQSRPADVPGKVLPVVVTVGPEDESQ